MDYRARLTKSQQTMNAKKVDAAFVTRRFAIGYLSGAFTPWSSALFVPAAGDAELITFAIDIPRVAQQSVWPTIHPYGGESSFASVITAFIAGKHLEKSKIGFDMGLAEDFGTLSANEYLQMVAACPKVAFVNIAPDFDEMLLIKTPEEIEAMRRAAEAADLGVKTAYDAMCIGMTETELAGWAELGIRRGGSTFNWCVTGTEIGAGYKQAYKHCFTTIPGNKRLQYGDIVTVDVHTMVDLYLSDLALNAIIGKPSLAQQKLADNWLALVQHLLGLIRPGAVCGDIFMKTWEKAVELGIDDITIPSFSHGLGVDVRIPPTISPGNPFVLDEMMTLEAIMQVGTPEVGGMRLEVPVLVTAAGCEVLTKTPLPLYVKAC